jgi:hypothetical protein
MADGCDAKTPGNPEPKRAYEKPAVVWEEALEERPNLIAACAQRPGDSVDCDASPFS